MDYLKYRYYLIESDQEIRNLENQYRATKDPTIAKKLVTAYKRMGMDDRIAQLDPWDAIDADRFYIEMPDWTSPTEGDAPIKRFFWHDVYMHQTTFGERAGRASLLALQEIAQVPSKILGYITTWKTAIANDRHFSETAVPWSIKGHAGYSRPNPPNPLEQVFSDGLVKLAQNPQLALAYAQLIKSELGFSPTWPTNTTIGKMALMSIRSVPEIYDKYLEIESDRRPPDYIDNLRFTINSLRP